MLSSCSAVAGVVLLELAGLTWSLSLLESLSFAGVVRICWGSAVGIRCGHRGHCWLLGLAGVIVIVVVVGVIAVVVVVGTCQDHSVRICLARRGRPCCWSRCRCPRRCWGFLGSCCLYWLGSSWLLSLLQSSVSWSLLRFAGVVLLGIAGVSVAVVVVEVVVVDVVGSFWGGIVGISWGHRGR